MGEPALAAGGMAAEPLRRVILWLVLFGMLGLAAELVLLEHFDEAWQFAPFVAIVLGVATGGALLARPSRGAVRATRLAMGACVVVAAIGVVLHYRGNAEFELERVPTLSGVALVRESVFGATPALAPGALLHLGLLGLACCWRHPAAIGRGEQRER